jgi:hypothetical protein
MRLRSAGPSSRLSSTTEKDTSPPATTRSKSPSLDAVRLEQGVNFGTVGPTGNLGITFNIFDEEAG